MRRIAGKLSVLCQSMLLAACAGTGSQPAALSIPDADSPQARAFAVRCSLCHAVPHPARHTFPDWVHLVALMERRMQERGVTAMSAEERALVLAYLKEHAR